MPRSKGGTGTDARAVLTIRTTPQLSDPREVDTILTSSLRALFGDLEPYSCQMQVRSIEAGCFEIRSDAPSHVRAAATMITAPPYMEDALFRFDVMSVRALGS
uniref:Uncharacterized protein n=1 Tax=Craspedostauros australis TaxID=1486917 RepID=A0A7R9ZJR2_9STRA